MIKAENAWWMLFFGILFGAVVGGNAASVSDKQVNHVVNGECDQ